MKLTVEEHGEPIKALLDGGDSYRRIAEQLGCDHGTVRKFVKANYPELVRDQRRAPLKAAPSKPGDPLTETDLLRAELKEARAAAGKGRTVDIQAERLLREFRDTVQPASRVYEAPEVGEGSGHPHVQALMLSDLHVGEVVDPEAVGGLNTYNWEVCQERMKGVYEALVSFQNNRPYPIEELHIWWLGDMCGGRNHQELAETNEFSVAEQCYVTGMLLGQWVEPLIEAFPRIKICGVAGNHPRVPQKPANKQVFDNFDWLAYRLAETYLSNYDTIEFAFPRSGYVVDEIAGNKALLLHGDGIRSTMPGVPLGGVTRRVNELTKQYASQGVKLDLFAMGHFHQSGVLGNVYMNGSLKGCDEFSLKQFGRGERPTQLLLTFDTVREQLTDVSFITP